MTMSTRPNFFLLLDLNPEEQWNQSAYQKALQDKIRQWNRESSSVAKKALPAQANRALLPQIRQVMETAALRAREAEEARKILLLRYQEARARFEKQLALLNLKEEADPEEVELFIQEFKQLVPVQDIQARITVKISKRRNSEGNALAPLDASLAKNIADRLELIQQKTLYELLRCSRTATSTALLAAANELYAQEVRQHPTALTTARLELAGFAMSLFKADEMRARYDETLRQSALQQLLDDLAASLKRSSNKELHPRQVRYYLEQAAAAGWSEQAAFARLKEQSRLQQWLITLPARDGEWRVENIAGELADPFDPLQPSVDADNVRQLQYRLLRATLRLYWQWPDDCQAVFLSYRAEPQSEPLQHYAPGVMTYYVGRAEYEQRGYYALASGGNGTQSYHVLVSAIVEQNGVRRLASGVELQIHCHKIRLTYKILPPYLLRRHCVLLLRAHPPDLLTLPPLLLLGREQRPPTRRGDGECVQRIEAGETNPRGELYLPLPARPASPQLFGRLFLADERLAGTILIQHPDPRQTRLC